MNYKECLVEVDEVLNHLVEEDLAKIPQEVRSKIKEEKDDNYIWHWNASKSLVEQNLNRNSIAILSYLNMEYLLDADQRRLMEEIHRENEKKKMSKARNFETVITDKTVKVASPSMHPIAYVEENKKWYTRIFEMVKRIFNR